MVLGYIFLAVFVCLIVWGVISILVHLCNCSQEAISDFIYDEFYDSNRNPLQSEEMIHYMYLIADTPGLNLIMAILFTFAAIILTIYLCARRILIYMWRLITGVPRGIKNIIYKIKRAPRRHPGISHIPKSIYMICKAAFVLLTCKKIK